MGGWEKREWEEMGRRENGDEGRLGGEEKGEWEAEGRLGRGETGRILKIGEERRWGSGAEESGDRRRGEGENRDGETCGSGEDQSNNDDLV